MPDQLDIPYRADPHALHKLDLFLPETPNGAGMLLIHGGGWRGGGREQWHSVARHLAGRGYVCVSAGYRLAPDAQWPAQIEDSRLAMAWLRKRADQYGLHPQRIAAMGSSAGGHLVALLATIAPDDDLGACEELILRDTRPNAVVCYCPVVTLHEKDRLAESVAALMGKPEADAPDAYRDGSPIDRIIGHEPPFLFVQGDTDETTPLPLTRAMHEKLQAAGVRSELIALDGAKHGFGYGVTSEHQKQAIAHVERFLGDVL